MNYALVIFHLVSGHLTTFVIMPPPSGLSLVECTEVKATTANEKGVTDAWCMDSALVLNTILTD